MNWRDYITADPKICHGAPCFKGTRVMVSVVFDNLAEGLTADEILAQYPSLQGDFLPAAMAFAAELTRERVVPLPGSDAA